VSRVSNPANRSNKQKHVRTDFKKSISPADWTAERGDAVTSLSPLSLDKQEQSSAPRDEKALGAFEKDWIHSRICFGSRTIDKSIEFRIHLELLFIARFRAESL
jgi:hypothetical protein